LNLYGIDQLKEKITTELGNLDQEKCIFMVKHFEGFSPIIVPKKDPNLYIGNPLNNMFHRFGIPHLNSISEFLTRLDPRTKPP
jgi:hypothetical protein